MVCGTITYVTTDLSIDVWSDVICPFCYLGSRQLAIALEQFEHRDEVVLRHRSFELDPHFNPADNVSVDELVARKYSFSVERARTLHERLEGQARGLGMNWSLATAKPGNTFDAHRLIALASTQGLGDEMNTRLFRAYFSEGALVSDHDTLSKLAGDADVTGVEALWNSSNYADDVRRDEVTAQGLGITGVPAFLIGETLLIVGARGSDELVDALNQAWARREV
jgi:predicted DsbA family dithiol-disulfide isomerase